MTSSPTDTFTVDRELLEHAAHVYREAGREDTNGYRQITDLLAPALTDKQKRDLLGIEHTITVTITEFHGHGTHARVRVPGGNHVLVPVADLNLQES